MPPRQGGDVTLHAVLHHKLHESTPAPERLEDAVTSTVFGSLVHANAWELLARWLRLPGDPHHVASGETDCWFWPRLELAEPDVLLRIGRILVLVEAKYRAPLGAAKGPKAQPSHSDSADERRLAEVASERRADQLRRQYRSLTLEPAQRLLYSEPIERAIRDCRIWQVYVVDNARHRQSLREFEKSMEGLPREATVVRWQDLTRLLERRARWARDLRAYLYDRRLDGFDGVGHWTTPSERLPILREWRAGRSSFDWPAMLAAAQATKAALAWRVHRRAVPGRLGGLPDAARLRALREWNPSGVRGSKGG